MGLSIKATGKSDIGRVRATNQDSYDVDHDTQLFVVADGMGGHAGGEIASSVAISEIKKYLDNHKSAISNGSTLNEPLICQHLASAVNHASARIYEMALEDPALRGMGTTVTLVKIIGDTAFTAHVGDSRLYLIRAGFLYQITYDHSLVNEQVRAGIITEEEAQKHHLKNVITRSVGYQEEEDVDTTSFKIEPKDFLLLSSDGLHGKILDYELSDRIKKEKLKAIKPLVDLANDRGGEDNITAIIVEVNKDEEREK